MFPGIGSLPHQTKKSIGGIFSVDGFLPSYAPCTIFTARVDCFLSSSLPQKTNTNQIRCRSRITVQTRMVWQRREPACRQTSPALPRRSRISIITAHGASAHYFPILPPLNIHTSFLFGQTRVTERKQSFSMGKRQAFRKTIKGEN